MRILSIALCVLLGVVEGGYAQVTRAPISQARSPITQERHRDASRIRLDGQAGSYLLLEDGYGLFLIEPITSQRIPR